MSKMISQREARQLKRRVADLEVVIQRQRSTYARSYPGGVNIGRLRWESTAHVASAVYAAQRLGHAVVAVAENQLAFNLYALPHPEMPV